MVDLLSTVQHAFIFVGVPTKGTHRGELFVFASAHQRRVVRFVVFVITRSVISKYHVVCFERALVEVGDGVLTADW